jgi:hypothetical protein
VTIDALLDQILIPRPNGSEGLARVADFISEVLDRSGATISSHEFVATPYGFQLVWSVVLVLLLGYCVSIATRHYGLALGLMVLTAALLLLEFEFLWSPISGLIPATERNVVGTFPGQPAGPTLIFAAHYDTTTHFGDHFSWGRWGFAQGPATGLAIGLALTGLWRARAGKHLPLALALPAAALASAPFAAMFWFQSIGPAVRVPSPGALDNGGSVVALLDLAQQLATREESGATTVKLVFLAAEEERALGSWAFAESLGTQDSLGVINLESIGASLDLAYIEEDGFALVRYHSPPHLTAIVNETAKELWGSALRPQELPAGVLTDGRSFLAHGIPALTLRAFIGDAFPRNLHSENDSRDRLVFAGIEKTTELMLGLIHAVDRNPSLLGGTQVP